MPVDGDGDNNDNIATIGRIVVGVPITLQIFIFSSQQHIY